MAEKPLHEKKLSDFIYELGDNVKVIYPNQLKQWIAAIEKATYTDDSWKILDFDEWESSNLDFWDAFRKFLKNRFELNEAELHGEDLK